MSLAIVQGNGPVVFGQEWLSTIHLFWQSIVFHTLVSKRLDKVLQQFKEVRHVELGSAHTLSIHLNLKENIARPSLSLQTSPFNLLLRMLSHRRLSAWIWSES